MVWLQVVQRFHACLHPASCIASVVATVCVVPLSPLYECIAMCMYVCVCVCVLLQGSSWSMSKVERLAPNVSISWT